MKSTKRTLEVLLISVGVGLSSVGCKESETSPQPEPISKVEYQPSVKNEDKEARERLEKTKKEMKLIEEESAKEWKLYEEEVKKRKIDSPFPRNKTADDEYNALREFSRLVMDFDGKKHKLKKQRSSRPEGYYDFGKNPELYVRENPDDPLGYLLVCKNRIRKLSRQIDIHNSRVDVGGWDRFGFFGDVEAYEIRNWLDEARSNCDKGNERLEALDDRMEVYNKLEALGENLDKNVTHLEKLFRKHNR